MLNHMCWPWGVVYRLRYKYENFPYSLDDPKRVCIVMETRKKFDEKNIFHRNFWLKIHIFHGHLKKSQPIELSLLACNWLKYDYETFLQSLGVAKHVRIELKNIKNFCWNKSFHRNFWLKFEISHGAITRKVPYVTDLSVKNFFETLNQKSASTVLLGLIWSTD